MLRKAWWKSWLTSTFTERHPLTSTRGEFGCVGSGGVCQARNSRFPNSSSVVAFKRTSESLSFKEDPGPLGPVWVFIKLLSNSRRETDTAFFPADESIPVSCAPVLLGSIVSTLLFHVKGNKPQTWSTDDVTKLLCAWDFTGGFPWSIQSYKSSVSIWLLLTFRSHHIPVISCCLLLSIPESRSRVPVFSMWHSFCNYYFSGRSTARWKNGRRELYHDHTSDTSSLLQIQALGFTVAPVYSPSIPTSSVLVEYLWYMCIWIFYKQLLNLIGRFDMEYKK